MGKILLMLAFVACTIGVYAQDKIDYAEVLLETEADYVTAKPYVKDAAEYLLNSPIDNSDLRRVDALQLILTWMGGISEEFDFEGYDNIGDDINVKTAYIAALAECYLTDNTRSGFWTIFLDYCNKQSAALKLSPSLKEKMNSK